MRSSLVFALSAFFFATGCDQLTATMQGVGVLTKTPDLTAAEGMPANLVATLPLADVKTPWGSRRKRAPPPRPIPHR